MTKGKRKTVEDVSPEVAQLRARTNENLVDVVRGPMRREDVGREILNRYPINEPRYLIVLIERTADPTKVMTTIYMGAEDFRKSSKPLPQHNTY